MTSVNDWDQVDAALKAAYHQSGHYAQCFARIRKLEREIHEIAQTGTLPDGDGVNIPTRLWAEGWRK